MMGVVVLRAGSGSGEGYDVAVIGAGACGCEAAARLGRLGYDVLLVTTSLDTVFAAPLERVVASAPDDTLMAEALPETRVAADGTIGAWELHTTVKYLLEAEPNVHLLQSNVDALDVRDGTVTGVETWEGVPRAARAVALCVGSFLRARLRVGDAEESAGRPGEMAYDALADHLAELGLPLTTVHASGNDVGHPSWSVRFERLADGALQGTRVHAIAGLYAAGICTAGLMSYEAAAQAGARLARDVATDLGPVRTT